MAKKNKKNSEQTRLSILNAACRIFSQNPYSAASIRMIANEGGVAHALIRYYFPTKADLFDSVAEQICADLYEACEQAATEVSRMERRQAFSQYLWRLIEFHKHQPWVFRILLLNLSVERVQTVPGQARIIEFVESVRDMLIKSQRFKAPLEEICRFSDSFNALLFYYLGTPDSAAWMLRMDPGSEAYLQWVHQTLTDIFHPALEDLFQKS